MMFWAIAEPAAAKKTMTAAPMSFDCF